MVFGNTFFGNMPGYWIEIEFSQLNMSHCNKFNFVYCYILIYCGSWSKFIFTLLLGVIIFVIRISKSEEFTKRIESQSIECMRL